MFGPYTQQKGFKTPPKNYTIILKKKYPPLIFFRSHPPEKIVHPPWKKRDLVSPVCGIFFYNLLKLVIRRSVIKGALQCSFSIIYLLYFVFSKVNCQVLCVMCQMSHVTNVNSHSRGPSPFRPTNFLTYTAGWCTKTQNKLSDQCLSITFFQWIIL